MEKKMSSEYIIQIMNDLRELLKMQSKEHVSLLKTVRDIAPDLADKWKPAFDECDRDNCILLRLCDKIVKAAEDGTPVKILMERVKAARAINQEFALKALKTTGLISEDLSKRIDEIQ